MIRPATEEDKKQLIEALHNCRYRLPFEGEELEQIIRQLAGSARIREVLLGSIVMQLSDEEIRQGKKLNELYFIMSGQLRSKGSRDRLLNYHAARSFIGEQVVLDDKPLSPITVDVIHDAKLAFWDRTSSEWPGLLNVQCRPYFEEVYKSRERRARQPFPGKQSDEVTIFRTGKHPMMLLVALIGPSLLFLFSLVLLILFLVMAVSLPLLVRLAAGLPAIFSLLWGTFSYADWRDDEYIVTNKRVIHIERYVFYGEEWDEAPLIRIQDVTVEASNLWERWLNFYDLKIQTAGAGTIWFVGLRDAEEAKEIIFEERTKAQERRQAANVYAIRRVLAAKTNTPIDELDLPAESIAPTTGVFSENQTRRLPFMIDYFWPRMAVAKSGTITWRKHWFVWLKKTWPAMLLCLGLFFLLALTLLRLPPFDELENTLLLVLFLLVGTAFAFLWYVYLYDDWHKDVYIVTNDRIVDVESSSFRLRGEKKREGTFDVVQNITYVVPSFFHKLLNMGSVTIETAGTEKTFTFIDVFNPSAIQQEVFNRMVAYQENKQQRQQASEDLGRAEWFTQYHLLLKGGEQPTPQSKPE